MTNPAELDAAEKAFDADVLRDPFRQVERTLAARHLWQIMEDLGYEATTSGQSAGAARERWLRADEAMQQALLFLRPFPGEAITLDPPDSLLLHRSNSFLENCYAYTRFARAFKRSRQGWATLDVTAQTIAVTYPPGAMAYIVYETFVRPMGITPRVQREAKRKAFSLKELTSPLDEVFIGAKAVLCTSFADQVLGSRECLPSHWQFSEYSLSDFRRCARVLFALSYFRFLAADSYRSRGYQSPLPLTIIPMSRLQYLVAHWSGVADSVVGAILSRLVYGTHGIDSPDPALQPLFPSGHESVLLPTYTLQFTDFERNHLALLQRLTVEQLLLAEQRNEKAKIMASAIAALFPPSFRPFSGRLPGRTDLPDVDLALISQDASECLLLELKWFYAPSEHLEKKYREEELSKGVTQLRKLTNTTDGADTLLRQHLKLSADCRIVPAVLSATWIGTEAAFDSNISIVHQADFMAEWASHQSFTRLLNWIQTRAFLPIGGTEYRDISATLALYGWTITFPLFEALSRGRFERLDRIHTL